jgi:hypothetical protein
METLLDRHYPIGKFVKPAQMDAAQLSEWINDIAQLPQLLRHALANLTPEQLEQPYRTGGWTRRQVAHHVADSHLNAYTRFKLALTETNPTIRPYEEAEWAKLADSALPVEVSLRLLEALHERWTVLLHSITQADFDRTFLHPATQMTWTLRHATGMYAWHGRHHTAHILLP